MALAIGLDIKSELPKAIKWTDAHTKQLPFSIAQAITATAKGIKTIPESKSKNVVSDLERLTKQRLDKPKPSTVKSYRATTANKRTLQAQILPKEKPYKRNRYIVGNIKGGPRPRTWANAFEQFGTIPSGHVLVPTRNVPRDRYGGPKRSFVKTALSNATRNPTAKGQVFVGQPANKRRPFGVYKLTASGQLRALFLAQPQAIYPSPLSRIYKLAQARTNNVFGPYLRKALKANVEAALAR